MTFPPTLLLLLALTLPLLYSPFCAETLKNYFVVDYSGSDGILFQLFINFLARCTFWQLNVNPSKSDILHLGQSNPLLPVNSVAPFFLVLSSQLILVSLIYQFLSFLFKTSFLFTTVL